MGDGPHESAHRSASATADEPLEALGGHKSFGLGSAHGHPRGLSHPSRAFR